MSLSNTTGLSAINSTIEIDGGAFSIEDDVKVKTAQSTISVVGGSFSSSDRVSFELFQTPFTVEGQVRLAGDSSSRYSLKDSPLTVQGTVTAGFERPSGDGALHCQWRVLE